jgi:two-component sensor histidine kinase
MSSDGSTAQEAEDSPPDGAPPQAETTRLLMQEMHHGVSNSLQLVSSMLQLQANRSKHPEIRQAFGEAIRRIAAVAGAHRHLHDIDRTGRVDAVSYLENLLDLLRTSLLTGSPEEAEGRRIEMRIPVALKLRAEDLSRSGLIVNELVTNALKYGAGRVLVVIRPLETGLELMVEDEGKGFPAGFDPARSGGFGMRLVTALALNGPASIRVDRSVPFGRMVVHTAAKPADPD